MRVVKTIQESAKDFTEVKLRRTSHSKTYHIDNKTYRTYQTISAQHWYDEESKQLKTIDLTPIDKGDHWFIDKASYILTVYKDSLNVEYTSKKGGTTIIKLKKIGGITVQNLNITPVIDDDGITFKDAVPGLDLQLRINPQGVEWYKILHNNTVPTTFEWEVLEDKDATFGHREVAIGNDADNNRIELINTKTQMQDVDGMNCFKLEEEFTGRIKKVQNKKTRVKKWSTDVTYPVTIDVPDVTETVVGADDGNNNTNLSEYYYWGDPSTGTPATAGSSSNMAGSYTAYWGRTGFATHEHLVHLTYGHRYFVKVYERNPVFRFTTVAVPVASVIALAEITINVWTVAGGGITTGVISGIDEDNVAVNSSGNRWAPKAKTTATTASGTINTTGLKTFVVTDIVQEIVDRGGWANNNAMGMFFNGPNAAAAKPLVSPPAATGYNAYGSMFEVLGVDTEETGGTNQAVLEITFELSGSTPQVNFIG